MEAQRSPDDGEKEKGLPLTGGPNNVNYLDLFM